MPKVRRTVSTGKKGSVDPEQLHSLLREFLTQGQTSRAARKSFGELAQSWLDRIVRVCPENEERHIAHLAALHHLREGELTKAKVEECLKALLKPRGPLGPATLNKVRGTGRLIILDAQGNGDWSGHNPFALVRRYQESRADYGTFTIEEVERVLPHLRPDRRREAKIMLLMGTRPGEVLGMMKTQVRLDQDPPHVVVNRSHGRAQTKTGRSRTVPIPTALLEEFRAQLKVQPGSPWLFPKPDGHRQRADTKLARTLRTAVGRAGIVTGYRLSCRRQGCGFKEVVEAEIQVGCPRCKMKLWCQPIPKCVRYYDLRHTAATLLRKAGADPLAIKVVQGWVAQNVGDDIYTHLDESTLVAELNKLLLKDRPPAAATAGGNPKATAGTLGTDNRERWMGVEPMTPSLGSSGLVVNSTTGHEPKEKLLTVRDLSVRLQVTTATLYRWVDKGLIPTVRLGSSLLRFRSTDVERLIAGGLSSEAHRDDSRLAEPEAGSKATGVHVRRSKKPRS
jgi:excisionase family DNA binding protein